MRIPVPVGVGGIETGWSSCATGAHDKREPGTAVWISEVVTIDASSLPFRYRVVANGNRLRPNKRPLVWDLFSRHVFDVPNDGYVGHIIELR